MLNHSINFDPRWFKIENWKYDIPFIYLWRVYKQNCYIGFLVIFITSFEKKIGRIFEKFTCFMFSCIFIYTHGDHPLEYFRDYVDFNLKILGSSVFGIIASIILILNKTPCISLQFWILSKNFYRLSWSSRISRINRFRDIYLFFN